MQKILIAALALLALPQSAAAQSYRLDPATSSVAAKVGFFGIGSRTASFPEAAGTAEVAHDSFAIDVVIDARKLTAGDTLTMNRLKGPDFFDVTNHPSVRFMGNRLAQTDATHGTVTGTLTARGVTKPLVLAVTFSRPPFQLSNAEPVAFEATTEIDRRDFGMTAYSLIVGKKVAITIRAKLVR